MDSSRKQVVLVDDATLVLETYARVLRPERREWELHFAQDADTALQIAAQHDLDVIVTDIRMEGKDGFDLIRALQASERTARIPIIVVTGDTEPTLKRRALDLGATDLLTKPINREDIIARIRSALRLKAYQDQVEEQMRTLDSQVRECAWALEQSHRDIIWRLAKAGEFRDDETGNHVVRVACYARAIAQGLGAPTDFVNTLFQTSPLHDIGKIGIPDSILLKFGPLTPEERNTMQQHCNIGATILWTEPRAVAVARRREASGQNSGGDIPKDPLLHMAMSIAKNHHEKWDGTGYPEGLARDEIPLEARIVALVDVFDALTSVRRYKPAFSLEKSVEIIQKDAGRHFDPELVAVFDRNRSEITAIHNELQEAEAYWNPLAG
ncbi:MAG TPA: response regulator [Candidatus Hydrogenedentes bacterium]|nr:response regulator [Candidatus Hydrogenedentota bacterium]